MAGMPARLALALVLLAGCSADNSNAPGAVGDRLRECGLISEGELPYLPFQLYAPTACYRDCLAGASCTQLEDAMCNGIDLGRICDERCAYRCGDDSLIAPDQECDGIMQCSDGEDEVGCPVGVEPSCARAVECDGYPQCADGRDELDCPMWTCDGGQEYPYSVRCNGWNSCTDGSDELDCATVTTMCPMP